MSDFYDGLETRRPDERTRFLTDAIRAQLVHARDCSEAFGTVLEGFDCEGFSELDELKRFPVTRKSDLMNLQQRTPPFGGLHAFAHDRIRHVHVSPGPIYEACTDRPDFWRMARALFAAGFRKGDLVHNSFSYHLTPAGMMMDGGCHVLGCGVIPGGVGQTDMQLRTIRDLEPDGYVGTPSFLRILLEKADEEKADIGSMTRGLVSGEALPMSLRAGFRERGIRVLQVYATADLGNIAYETVPDAGLVIDEGVHVEIVRPGSGNPVPDGEVGEVVVTTLNPDYPLIRFATGDMSAIVSGSSECGRTNRRIKGWMGRADQTAKVRGMFIHPEQVQAIVSRHVEIDKARLVIDWIDQQDQMTLLCETGSSPEGLEDAVAQSIRDLCKVRGEVRLVAPGSIRNDGLVIEDIRKYE